MQMQELYSRETIARRIKEMGAAISTAYQGQQLVVVGVLKGSFIFVADLIREIKCDVVVDFIGVSSYVGTSSSGEVRVTHDLGSEIQGKHVLLVEDIVDTGRTIDFLLDSLLVRKPASLKIATLLSKPDSHQMTHPLDFIGFEIAREFVIGYGLDLDGRYRQLPNIMQILD